MTYDCYEYDTKSCEPVSSADSRARAAGGPASSPTRRGSRGAQADLRAPSPRAVQFDIPRDSGAPNTINLF